LALTQNGLVSCRRTRKYALYPLYAIFKIWTVLSSNLCKENRVFHNLLDALSSLVFTSTFNFIYHIWHSCPTTGAARLDGLQPSLKNVRQKIPANGQTRLKFGFSYENFTTQSFSVLPTPFRLNVSSESNKTNVC